MDQIMLITINNVGNSIVNWKITMELILSLKVEVMLQKHKIHNLGPNYDKDLSVKHLLWMELVDK